MRLIDLINAPWAIEPGKLEELQAVYLAHVRGEKIDIAAVEARLGRPLAAEQQGYDVIDGVAVVPVDGVIAQKANLFSRISGGASAQLIERDVRGALADSRVKAILLEVNSPGGTVHGTQELAWLIDAARQEKPIAAFATGQLASAAYWIGAAADRVYVSGDNVFVGSIGIVASHIDRSRADEQLGVKRTEIVAGKYKRIASENAPLSKEGRANMQEFVDYLYSVFVGDVAAFRGVPVETVLSDMADGRVFIGRQAIQAGLVDGVSTRDDVIAELSSGRMPRRGATRKPRAVQPVGAGGVPAAPELPGAVQQDPPAASAAGNATEPESGGAPRTEVAGVLPQPSHPTQGTDMTRNEFRAAYPQLFEEIFNEARTAGATAERARIQAVEAQMLPGHEKLIASLKYDGSTTGEQAAAQVLAAERTRLGNHAASLAQDAASLGALAPSASAAPAAPAKPAESPADNSPEAIEARCKATWESDAGVRAAHVDLKTYTAYEKAVAAGRVKVLSGSKRAA